VSADGYILMFTDGITNGHVPSLIPPVNVPHHCMEIPV